MSDGLRVQCPHCSATLKIKSSGDVDRRKMIKCPQCQTPFSVGDGVEQFYSSTAATSDSPAPSPRKPTASPPPVPSSAPVSTTPPVPPVPKATRAPGEAPKSTSGAQKKKRPAASSQESNEWDDGGGDLFGGVSSEGSAYGDEWGGGDSAGDPYENDAYGTSPSRKRSSSSGGRRPTAAQRTELPAVRRMGFFGWVLFGGLAGLLGVGLSTLSGFSNMPFVIGLMALFVGPMVGFGVRFGAGESTGIWPGLIAICIALMSIVVGKVGAFSVAETGLGRQDLEEIAAPDGEESFMDELEKESLTESAMIGRQASKVQDEWLTGGRLSQEQIDNFWEQQESSYSPSEDYLPEVWTEATTRWQAMTPENKSATLQTVQREWYGDEPGLEPADENDAQEWLADAVTEEWLNGGRITQEQLDAHDEALMNAPVDHSTQYLPEVWQEGLNRWTAMSPEQKSAESAAVRQELKEVREMGETFVKGLGWVLVVGQALLNCFWPLSSPFFLFGGVSAAYRMGSHGGSKT